MAKCAGKNRKDGRCGSDALPRSKYCGAHQNQAIDKGNKDKQLISDKSLICKRISWEILLPIIVAVLSLIIASAALYFSNLYPRLDVKIVSPTPGKNLYADFDFTNQGYLPLIDARAIVRFKEAYDESTVSLDNLPPFTSPLLDLGYMRPGYTVTGRTPEMISATEWKKVRLCLVTSYRIFWFIKWTQEDGFLLDKDKHIDRWIKRPCE